MTEKKNCLTLLKNLYPQQSLFQEFNPQGEEAAKIYMILECFDEMDYVEAKSLGYAIDYLLFNVVHDKNQSWGDTVKHLNELTYGPKQDARYSIPINELAKKANQTPDLGVYEFNQKLKNGTAFTTFRSILIYQIYLILYNYSKNFPISFSVSIANTFSYIYYLMNNWNLEWESLWNIESVLAQSPKLKTYHGGIDFLNLIENLNKIKDLQSPPERVKAIKIYLKFLGLYISYQINKQNEAPMIPNQPFFPPNGSSFGQPLITNEPQPELLLADIKTPFQPSQDLNTFEVPETDLEVSIIPLSDIPDKDKFEPTSNLITLSEINNLINENDFLLDLVKSELKLMHYKLSNYNRMKSEIEQNLNEEAGSMDAKVKLALQKKINMINVILEMIKNRADNLQKKSDSQKIKDKQQNLKDILEDKDNGILSIKGDSRENIRRYLYSQIYIFSKAPELYVKNFMNYTLMGPAGSGKTKIAGVVAYVYNNLGLLSSANKNGKFLVVTRADLVGGAVGHTAPKTRDYLEKILEGVLLIDEAYQLSGCPDQSGSFSSKDYGQESITEIVNFIDKHIGLSVIIAAGYEGKIVDCFLAINEGMKRRFPNNMRLMLYSAKDLFEILMAFISDKFKFNVFTPSQSQYIYKLIEKEERR